MNFVLFDDFRPGILRDGRVIDISGLLPGIDFARHPRDTVSGFITRYDELKPRLAGLSGGVPLESVRLRQPSPDPHQLLCAAKNYKDGHETPAVDFFLKAQQTIIGPGDTIELPSVKASVFNAEPELAVVIGKPAQNVSAANAMDYVFGYTCFLDVSARKVSPTYYKHKSYWTFAPLGPTIVTADEVPDPHNLRVRFWVDGDLRQDFSTSLMANRIEKLIEVASSVCPLKPGDIIPTGTHHIGLSPIQDGETVTVEVERVGRLSVKVHDAARRTWEKPAPLQAATA
jgi:2-keto-4-pentenoate hydratase/2-oxohepta-3-ene-1,7-dioic acid hydratase in catechol pathway